jgi:hypothetical protein
LPLPAHYPGTWRLAEHSPAEIDPRHEDERSAVLGSLLQHSRGDLPEIGVIDPAISNGRI